MAFDVISCTKSDVDEWILMHSAHGAESDASDCELLWSKMTESPQADFVFQCRSTWELTSDEVTSLNYFNFSQRATNATKLDVNAEAIDASDLAKVVDVACDFTRDAQEDDDSRFRMTCAMLSRTFIRSGCFVNEVAKQLSAGRPTAQRLILCLAASIGIACVVSVVSLIYLSRTGAVLASVVAWSCSLLFAWMLLLKSPMRDDVCDLEPEGDGRAFLTKVAMVVARKA